MPPSLSAGSSVNSLDLNEFDNVYAEIDINTAIVSSTNTNNTIAIAIIDTADADTNHDIQSNVFDSIPSLNMLDCVWGGLNTSEVNLFNVEGDIGSDNDGVPGADVEKVAADDPQVHEQDFVQDEVEIRHKEIDSVLMKSADSIPMIDATDDGAYKVPKKMVVPYANQEVADNLKVEESQHLYDIDVNDQNRSTGAIKKVDHKQYGGSEAKITPTPFYFATKSVNTLLSTIKEKVKKTTNSPVDIFEPVADASSNAGEERPAIKNNDRSGSPARTIAETTIPCEDSRFNDINLKNRIKQKFKFGFRFAAAAKKSKICQRCLLPPPPSPAKNVVSRANKGIGTTHDATNLLDSSQYYYCTCDVDFGDDGTRGKDHYSDLIGVSIHYSILFHAQLQSSSACSLLSLMIT